MEPEDVVLLLNNYFQEMIDVVFKNNGTLDKIIGDELMVLYGVQAQSSWALLHMFTANPQKIVSVDTISRFMELSYAVTQKQTEGTGNIDRLTDDNSI